MSDHASLKAILRAAVQAALAAGHDDDTIAVAVYDVVADEREADDKEHRHVEDACDLVRETASRIHAVLWHVAAMRRNGHLFSLAVGAETALEALGDALQERHIKRTGRER